MMLSWHFGILTPSPGGLRVVSLFARWSGGLEVGGDVVGFEVGDDFVGLEVGGDFVGLEVGGPKDSRWVMV